MTDDEWEAHLELWPICYQFKWTHCNVTDKIDIVLNQAFQVDVFYLLPYHSIRFKLKEHLDLFLLLMGY